MLLLYYFVRLCHFNFFKEPNVCCLREQERERVFFPPVALVACITKVWKARRSATDKFVARCGDRSRLSKISTFAPSLSFLSFSLFPSLFRRVLLRVPPPPLDQKSPLPANFSDDGWRRRVHFLRIPPSRPHLQLKLLQVSLCSGIATLASPDNYRRNSRKIPH